MVNTTTWIALGLLVGLAAFISWIVSWANRNHGYGKDMDKRVQG